MNYYNKHKSNNGNSFINGKPYFVKHPKYIGKLIWASLSRGTYNKSIHGPIGSKAI